MKNGEIVHTGRVAAIAENSRGFSLVELMVTVGILSVVALSSATMMSDMARESARFRRVTERNNFEQKLVALYQKSDLCTCNFGGATPTTIPDSPGFRDVAGLKSGCGTATNDVYQANPAGFDVDSHLKVMSIKISDPQFVNATDYTATATIEYDNNPTYGSLRPGKYSFIFTKPAASVAPYPVQSCTLGGAISGGGASAGWSLSGNAATGPADYFGTSDNQDVFFRRNGVLAGMLKTDNTSFGVNALANVSGSNNVGIGVGALNGATSGSNNVGIGLNSGGLASDTDKTASGSNNTYLGAGSGPVNGVGNSNQTAIGYNAKATGNNVMVLGGTGNDSVNVGIGTSSPDQMLNVIAPATAAATTSAAKGIAIRTQNGPFGGGGGDIKLLLGTGQVGKTGRVDITNSGVAMEASTLLDVSLVSLNVSYGKMVGAHFQVNDNTAAGQGSAIGSESVVLQSSANGFVTAIGAVGNAALVMGAAGNTGTLIGVRGMATNQFSGSTSQGMGGYFTSDQGAGTFQESYGVYIGSVTGTKKWSLYASDPVAPSYIAGALGLGVAAPTEKLHIVGNLRVQGSTDCTLGNGAGGTNCSSDLRLKDNVVEIADASGKIRGLRGVEFDWNSKARSPGRHDIGVIAQEVERVFPTAVVTDPSTGYKKVDYAVLVAPLIQAFNELVDKVANILLRVDAHDREIKTLKSQIEVMKTEQQDLRARLEAIEKRKH